MTLKQHIAVWEDRVKNLPPHKRAESLLVFIESYQDHVYGSHSEVVYTS